LLRLRLLLDFTRPYITHQPTDWETTQVALQTEMHDTLCKFSSWDFST